MSRPWSPASHQLQADADYPPDIVAKAPEKPPVSPALPAPPAQAKQVTKAAVPAAPTPYLGRHRRHSYNFFDILLLMTPTPFGGAPLTGERV